MTRTVSVAELGHGGASRAVRDAEQGPVLVSKSNRPTAWIVSAEKLARIASARGVEPDVYERALELLAIDLYRDEVLTLGQAAKLAGLPLGDFIDLCGRLQVPILWGTAESVEADVDPWRRKDASRDRG
ncbi:MAG: UPF0175 family protein [Chloroflexota bacterium]